VNFSKIRDLAFAHFFREVGKYVCRMSGAIPSPLLDPYPRDLGILQAYDFFDRVTDN
jgi:hypothetical protein